MRMTIFALILGMLITLPTTAADLPSPDEIVVSLVAQHRNGARNAELELGLVNQLEQLATAHPEYWRAQFWAAYFLTQIVMSHPEHRVERLDRAQKNLDAATIRAKKAQEYSPADFLSLQSLVYDFRRTTVEGEAMDQFKLKSDQAEHGAFEADPQNPVAMVMAATNIINAGQRSKNWDQIMGGHALLLNAQKKFMDDERPRGLTTHFNSEWVRPWVNWVERLYAGGFEAE